jgi:EmrB/QacA subfamily drug resistance transporter
VLVFIALQLGMMLSTIDGTIVATALPSIVRDIGGFAHVTWVVTAYFLAMVASMPLYGKLGDLHGRKRVLLVALTVFLVGSVACGGAQRMDQLLLARFVQGLGAGGLATVGMAVVADIVPARQLGRWLGYQGMAFAVGSVLGPVLGGLFVDHLSWRWAFLINLPIGLLAMGILLTQLRVPYRRLPHALDVAGALLLTAALACFVVVTTMGGHELRWRSPAAIALMVATAVLAVVFVRWESRVAEPVLPLRLLGDRVIRTSLGVNFTSGLLLWCGIFFVPMFAQEVKGISPTNSGVVLTPLMFGAAFGTMISGRRVERTGHLRVWPIAGSVLMLAGVLSLGLLDADTPIAAAAGFALLLGTGVGFVMQPSLLAAQNAAPAHDLGTATSTALLIRTMGSTVGIPVFGGILNAGLDGKTRDAAAFADALPRVFLAAVPIAAVSILVALRLPDRPLRERPHLDEAAEVDAATPPHAFA